MQHHHILIVGAADTGRAPMTVALLQRQLAQHGLSCPIASAGILGHDDAPAETEARAALLVLGLDLSNHCARSLTEELVAQATCLIAVDSGVARVVRARFPHAPVYSLGELAGRARDIPDPFRMQMGAWLLYANEIDALLKAGMPRLLGLLGATSEDEPPPPPAPPSQEPLGIVAENRSSNDEVAPSVNPTSLTQALALLQLAATLPTALNWPIVCPQLMATLDELEAPLPTLSLARPYIATLRVMLQRYLGGPTAPQAQQLLAGFQRLREPIGPSELAALSQALT